MIQHLNQEFGIEKLVVGAEYIKLIWVPDTFFVNEKIALFHQATTENQFLRITHTGEVLRSMRLTIKATCPMNLANFPMDTQVQLTHHKLFRSEKKKYSGVFWHFDPD